MPRSRRPERRLRAQVIATHTTCYVCGKPVDRTLSGMHPNGPTLEHKQPVSQGGQTTPANAALSHRHCNLSRGNHPIEPVTTQHW